MANGGAQKKIGNAQAMWLRPHRTAGRGLKVVKHLEAGPGSFEQSFSCAADQESQEQKSESRALKFETIALIQESKGLTSESRQDKL